MFVGECAESFYRSMTPSEWEEVVGNQMETGLHRRLASRCGFSDSVAEDALDEIRKVVDGGWERYVHKERKEGLGCGPLLRITAGFVCLFVVTFWSVSTKG